MKKTNALLLLSWAALTVNAWAEPDCGPVDDYGFVCGLQNPEDLVHIPDSPWLIASGMAAGAPLYLIDVKEKAWTELYSGTSGETNAASKQYADCPGPPNTATWVTHGLNLQPGSDGHSTLYVVAHGARESIEVFDLQVIDEQPRLTWSGCLLTPEGMAANSVASMADGTLLITIPLRHGFTIGESLSGKPTGGAYRWSPGDSGFSALEGTDMPYANGIEVSMDGKEFYIASSGMSNVTAWSNTNPARLLRRSETLTIIPDNLHRSPDGSLITAGLNIDYPACGVLDPSVPFDLEAFAACPRPFTVWSVDPQTMQGRALATGPANPLFSNITMAVPVGDELWIGTFAGDRVAYRNY